MKHDFDEGVDRRHCVLGGGGRRTPGASGASEVQSRRRRRVDRCGGHRSQRRGRSRPDGCGFRSVPERKAAEGRVRAVRARDPVAARPASHGASPAPAPVATEAPPIPAPPITREQVRRTIVVVVDDLGLSIEGMNSTRPALRGFVDEELLPTDVMAIVRTGESRGCCSAHERSRGVAGRDRRAAIQRAVAQGRVASGDVIQLGMQRPHSMKWRPAALGVGHRIVAALNLVVQAARDLPGRKTVIFASEGFQLTDGTAPTIAPGPGPRVRDALDRVIDQAARSGVVIYAIDGRALDRRIEGGGRHPLRRPGT